MSLRLKLLLIITPVFTIAWLIASYFSITQLKAEVNHVMDSRLRSTAKMVNNLILSGQQSNTVFGPKAIALANDAGTAKGLACKISSLNGEVIANSHPKELTLPLSLPSGFEEIVSKGIAWRTYTLSTRYHNIAIAEKLSERKALFHQIVLVNAIPTLIAIIVSFILIWFALGRELRPLRLLKEAVTHRTADDLRPIEIKHKLIELTSLIDSQNTLFKKLEKAIEREKSFTENAAHELKTPLTGIISQLQVAKVTNGQTQRNALNQSEYSAIRLKNLTENLLLLARIESLDALKNTRAWNLKSELQSIYAELGVRESDINLQLTTATAVERIPAFAFNIILKNILENAIQHGDGQTPITLIIADDNDRLLVKIMNKATLPAETLDKMSQKFWRSGTSRGTGLGLAIVQAVVEKLEGAITFSNEDNHYFTVCITLPY